MIAIRRVYKDIKDSISQFLFKKRTRILENCGPSGENRTGYVDRKEGVRKFIRETGSEDSMLTINDYYDDGGSLRFVFITAGSVNGTRMEQRIYFNMSSVRIREDPKFVEGPGYPFLRFSDQDGLLSHDGLRAYAERCGDGA